MLHRSAARKVVVAKGPRMAGACNWGVPDNPPRRAKGCGRHPFRAASLYFRSCAHATTTPRAQYRPAAKWQAQGRCSCCTPAPAGRHKSRPGGCYSQSFRRRSRTTTQPRLNCQCCQKQRETQFLHLGMSPISKISRTSSANRGSFLSCPSITEITSPIFFAPAFR